MVNQLTDALKAPLENKLETSSPRQVALVWGLIGFLLARV